MIRDLTRKHSVGLLALFVVLGGTAFAGVERGASRQGNEPRLGEPRGIEARVEWGRSNPLNAEVKCPAGWRALSGGPSGAQRYAKSSLPIIQLPIEQGSVATIGWRVHFRYTGERPSKYVKLFVICAPLG